MRSITASVGAGATNRATDVKTVQELLNKVPVNEGGPSVPLKVDGLCWGKTVAAIKRFQSINLEHKWPDGRVDSNGKTLTALNKYDEKPAPAKHLVHTVPGYKVVVAQDNENACWAAVYTMLRSWREGKKFTIDEALQKPGPYYVWLHANKFTLPASKMREFWIRGGLTVRGNAFFTDDIWYDLLKNHGLLAVGSANAIVSSPGLHLRVVEGINVIGSAGDGYHIMDSGFGGKKYTERAFDFEAKYNLAMAAGGGAHWQVAHYY